MLMFKSTHEAVLLDLQIKSVEAKIVSLKETGDLLKRIAGYQDRLIEVLKDNAELRRKIIKSHTDKLEVNS